MLFMTGFIGGIFTAIAGSGVDICSTAILSLLFRYGLARSFAFQGNPFSILQNNPA
jgi:hypothetical protein